MAKGRKRKRQPYADKNDDDFVQLDQSIPQPAEPGAHFYSSMNELPWDLQTHWKHRRSMFSLYDKGIWTTDDSWFEVTHESVANKIADHVAASRPEKKLILLDCFAGIGGNAIAFARSGVFKRVYAIEKNLAALRCAQQNARVYGVHDRISFFHGDCFELLGVDDSLDQSKVVKELTQVISAFGILFASPPWGGPGYKDAGDVFDLNQMPYSLDYMYKCFSRTTGQMVLYLPRTSDLNQVAECVGEDEKAQVVHYCIHENSKALCVYLGDWKKIQR